MMHVYLGNNFKICPGEKISPIEVDAVLLSHPDVAQAVCFGVPDEKYGEEVFLIYKIRKLTTPSS